MTKAWVWRKKNPKASEKSFDEYIKAVFPGVQRQDAINKFTNQ